MKPRSGGGLELDYLADAFLEVGREAAGHDRAAAVHAVDDVCGDGRVRLTEHVDPALAPAALLGGAARGGGAGGPGAELLLLGVDAAVQPEARDAVALRRHVRHRTVQQLFEAAQRELPARARADETRDSSCQIANGRRNCGRKREGAPTWDRGLRGASLEDDMPDPCVRKLCCVPFAC
jgi:hypothetical protein